MYECRVEREEEGGGGPGDWRSHTTWQRASTARYELTTAEALLGTPRPPTSSKCAVPPPPGSLTGVPRSTRALCCCVARRSVSATGEVVLERGSSQQVWMTPPGWQLLIDGICLRLGSNFHIVIITIPARLTELILVANSGYSLEPLATSQSPSLDRSRDPINTVLG